MERREAPGLVVDPGPAPRIDPCPVTVAIGRPSGMQPAREPDVAVIGDRGPRPVRVEVLVADHLRRDVAGRHDAVVAPIALGRPAVERVGPRQRDVFAVAEVAAVEAVRLPRRHDVRRAFAVYIAHALAHDHRRRPVLGIDLDAVAARSRQREREIRRVDLDDVARREPAHAHVERPLMQLQLRDAIVEVRHGDARQRAEPPGAGVDAQFRPRTVVGPDAVAADDRPVEARLDPVVVAGGREAHLALQMRQAADADRRIVAAGRLRQRARRDARQERGREQKKGRPAHQCVCSSVHRVLFL